MITPSEVIEEFEQIQKVIETTEQYYDAYGLRLSIAILKNSSIVLSSKHWFKNCYIQVKSNNDPKFVYGLWDIVLSVSRKIKRELERNNNETNFVFISSLNRDQTNKVYKEIINELNNRKLVSVVVESIDLLGWDVYDENVIKIPWVSGVGVWWD